MAGWPVLRLLIRFFDGVGIWSASPRMAMVPALEGGDPIVVERRTELGRLRSSRWVKSLVVVALVGGTGVSLSGCQAEPGSTSSGSSTVSKLPSLSPEKQLMEDNIAAAEEAVRNYVTVAGEVANDHFKGWEKLQPLVTDEERVRLNEDYEFMESTGNYTTGTPEISEVSVSRYQAEPVGGERVRLKACVDVAKVESFTGDGEVISPGEDELLVRAIWFEMLKQEEASWLVDEMTYDLDKPC